LKKNKAVILVDTREQEPYWDLKNLDEGQSFEYPSGLKMRREALKTGDYTLAGLEDKFAIERKSLSDIYGCVGGGRERFTKELMRARTFRALISDEEIQQKLKICKIEPSKALLEAIAKPPTFLDFVILVEASPEKFLQPWKVMCQLHPNHIRGAVYHWRRKYGIRWKFVNTRAEGRDYVFDQLKEWWNEYQVGLWTPLEKKKAVKKS